MGLGREASPSTRGAGGGTNKGGRTPGRPLLAWLAAQPAARLPAKAVVLHSPYSCRILVGYR